jgi:predicted kinase
MFNDIEGKNFIIMMGLPKSGKTTFVYNDLKKDDNVVVSADSLRQLIYGQEFYANGESVVWSVHQYMLQELMRQNANIIVDNTNKTIKTRQSLINAAKEMGYNVIGIMMATPYEVCEKRAKNENFPIETLVEAANKWENPTEDEGFDKIIVIDSEKYTSKDNQNNETL